MSGELIERLRRNAGFRNEQWHCITDPALLTEAAAALTAALAKVEKLRLMVRTQAEEAAKAAYAYSDGMGQLRAEVEKLTRERDEAREMALEEAAQVAYVTCAETRHVTLGDKVAARIRNLSEPRP